MTTEGGGWTGIVDADYSVDSCPSGWATDTTYAACMRPTASGASTATATFDILGVTYSEVYGLAAMSTIGSPHGFHGAGDVTGTRGIGNRFVDGASFTHGSGGARTHIFSYGFGYSSGGYSALDCPADGGISPPGFVGTDCLCATNNPNPYGGWSSYGTASFRGTNWQIALSSSTTDDIDGRLMGDELVYNEQVYVESLELWIR